MTEDAAKELATKILKAIGDDHHGEIVFKALVMVNAQFIRQQRYPRRVFEMMTENLTREVPQ